jgi:hypothetical protein
MTKRSSPPPARPPARSGAASSTQGVYLADPHRGRWRPSPVEARRQGATARGRGDAAPKRPGPRGLTMTHVTGGAHRPEPRESPARAHRVAIGHRLQRHCDGAGESSRCSAGRARASQIHLTRTRFVSIALVRACHSGALALRPEQARLGAVSRRSLLKGAAARRQVPRLRRCPVVVLSGSSLISDARCEDGEPISPRSPRTARRRLPWACDHRRR